MRKLLSIFLAVVMLAGMMTVAIPVSAETSEVTYDSLEKQLADNPEADKFYIEDETDYEFFISYLAKGKGTSDFAQVGASPWDATATGAFAGKTVYLVNDIELNKDTGFDADNKEKFAANDAYNNTNNAIKGFGGTFDGQGHKVSGVCFVGTEASHGSLFGNAFGNVTVKNVTFANCYIQTKNPALGGLFSTVTTGSNVSIENVCLASDFVIYSVRTSKGSSSAIGGFVGSVSSATLNIKNSVFLGIMSTNQTINLGGTGGLVGMVYSKTQDATVTMDNSGFFGNFAWNQGSTAAVSKFVGRLEGAGAFTTTLNFNNCIIGGDSGDSKITYIAVGMVYTTAAGAHIQINGTNSVWTKQGDKNSCPGGAYTGSKGTYTLKLKTCGFIPEESSFVGDTAFVNGEVVNGAGTSQGTADLNTYWVRTETNPMPRAIEEKVQPGTLKYDFLMCAKDLYIKTAEDYVYFFNNKSLFAKDQTIYLANDIDLNPEWTSKIIDVTVPAGPGADDVFGTDDDVPETTTKGIDKTGLTVELNTVKDSGFIGTFNGQGNTIRGAYATGDTSDGAALIGRVNGGTIKNVKFENCAVEAKVARTGGLVSVAAGVSTIENVVADIDVVGKGDCGGIVALTVNSNATKTYLTNVVYNGEIVAKGSNVGGLVGRSWDDSATYLTNCAFYGSITAPDGAAAGKLVGASSAGSTDASAKRNMESEIVITGCIAAGTANYDTYINGALVGQCEFADRCVETIEEEGKDPVNCAEKSHKITITITNSLFTPMEEGQTATGMCIMSAEVEANENNAYTVTDNSVASDANYLDGGFAYVGYQVKAVDGGYTIRFIGQGDDLSINEVGMTVAASGGNLEGEVAGSKATTKVYGGLIVGEEGGDDDYMAPEGSYVYTMNVGTFTADMGVITVNVTMFAKVGEAQFATSVRTVTIDTAKLPAFAGVAEA